MNPVGLKMKQAVHQTMAQKLKLSSFKLWARAVPAGPEKPSICCLDRLCDRGTAQSQYKQALRLYTTSGCLRSLRVGYFYHLQRQSQATTVKILKLMIFHYYFSYEESSFVRTTHETRITGALAQQSSSRRRHAFSGINIKPHTGKLFGMCLPYLKSVSPYRRGIEEVYLRIWEKHRRMIAPCCLTIRWRRRCTHRHLLMEGRKKFNSPQSDVEGDFDVESSPMIL